VGLFKKKLGTMPVPGEVTLDLPKGKVVIEYDEERRDRDLDASWPGVPDGLQIAVRPSGGGEALTVTHGVDSEGVTRDRISSKVGRVDVPAAGAYTITVEPFTPDRELFDPMLTIKG
jgi:hypothetical protein